jgi:hypothetical protein
MRSFQQIVVFLFALLVCAFAQESEYESTVYITSTVYRVNTVTLASSPTGAVMNQTSTIPAVHPTAAVVPSYPAGNGTATIMPTASQGMPAPSQFTGAASSLNANAFLAALAAGVGYLVL